ncbi:hypothetical protein LPJ71_000462, partial [Coemansia sp. S17]
MAREINVSASVPAIVSGVAHKLLVEYIGDTKCFPFAGRLRLTTKSLDSKPQPFDPIMAIPNALAFAKLLKSMAPAAVSTEIVWNRGTTQRLYIKGNADCDLDEEILKILADDLFANTKHANLDVSQTTVENISTIDSIPPLSFLKIDDTRHSSVPASLVHKCASTLWNLNIRTDNPDMLICDTNDKGVVYPNLEHLQLDSLRRAYSDSKKITTDMVPFPGLKTLVLAIPYPFEDDVLFRGNNETLEYLNFCLDDEIIAKLIRGRVLEGKNK